jgi:hypothetical protein
MFKVKNVINIIRSVAVKNYVERNCNADKSYINTSINWPLAAEVNIA